MEEPMLPPRPLRRVVLAPLVIVLAIAVIVLSPLIALLALTFGLVRRSRSGRAGRLRGVRLLVFALVWLTAETATLFMCLGLWLASGFGGRMHTEPFQSRHYAIMRWFLDVLYRTATGAFGLRVEVDEPELTAEEQAARLARPVRPRPPGQAERQGEEGDQRGKDDERDREDDHQRCQHQPAQQPGWEHGLLRPRRPDQSPASSARYRADAVYARSILAATPVMSR